MNCFTMLLLNIFIIVQGFGGIDEMMVHIKKTNMLLLKLR